MSFIPLFASPVSGSTAGAIVKHTLGKLWIVGVAVNKQIRSLSRGKDCDDLLTEVYHRIYGPAQEDSSARKIPIRMIMGTLDKAVSATDRSAAFARYQKVQPLEFDFNHSNIKAPDTHIDVRYKALTNDLQDDIACRFQLLCEDLLSKDQDTKDVALIEFYKRYETLLRRRFKDSGIDTDDGQNNYGTFIKIVIRDGARFGRPPFDTANRAIIVLSEHRLNF